MSVTAWICTSVRGSVISMPDQELSIQIVQAMEQYSDAVHAEIRAGLQTVGETALKKVKAASPFRTGKYRRGWKLDTNDAGGLLEMTIHQSKANASLTHLLEDGHRTRNKKGWVKAQPHIRAVENWAEQEAEKTIEKAVKG